MGNDLELRKRHLLRRFGFGAGESDYARVAKLNFGQTVDAVLRTDAPDAGSPFRFCYRADEEPDTNTYRFRIFWASQMVTSPAPLREKLALFWHSHFAVSDAKVEHGPMMMNYLQALRKDPAGKFVDLLPRMVKNAAFLRYLDVQDLTRGRPNENFARELLELYTLGIGKYSETDIKEVARAMTGWGYRDVWWNLGSNDRQRLDRIREDGIPGAAFTYAPEFHDDGEKTILGQKRRFDGDEVLRFLATRLETATFLCTKLWKFFASHEVAPKAVERMAKRFVATQGDTEQVLREMIKCPEFWTDAVVGQKVKSPAEFAVGYLRAQNWRENLIPMMVANAPDVQPMDNQVVDGVGYLAYAMMLMGQELLVPPGVEGWAEGPAWITSNNMVRRRDFAGIWTWVKQPKEGKEEHYVPGKGLQYLCQRLVERKPASVAEMVTGVATLMDVSLTEGSRATLTSHFEKHQGLEPLKHPEWLGGVISGALDLLRLAPEYHLC